MDDGDIKSALIETGFRVKAARQHRKLTPEQLAERMNVSRITICGWEGAHAGRYSVETALRLADALGVTPGWLLTGSGKRDAKAVKP